MIEVNGLSFAYPRCRERTLHQLDFRIAEGEIFGILGPSGAGKSTLQKILTGILKNYEGSAKMMGIEIRTSDSALNEQIGVAFEFPNFYTKFTALENLQLFGSLYKKQAVNPMDLLREVGLQDAAGMRVSQLSKGMKMRLNFCRALLHEPAILFLDEPTSGLDPGHAEGMKALIRNQKAMGKTVIITTHHMKVAEELCDRIAFLVDGSIKLIDSPRELMVRRGTKRLAVEYRRNDGVLARTEFSLEGIGDNPDFLHTIRQFPLETIHSQEASLEQIFIEVTGRKLQ
ncbi:ABC transporter ATP-binding protein [Paenibacillus sp. J5C_2022]|uniref:ABC transporter ATP-binding protein n=1 Tax=Paenibacillus sp. J5C2022 TaxID=2977129 RepID=UPI0021D1CF51|nr:ABC transporter ATP-binding protein [Paenibacillus sp. J5C2022]MCU6710637.1 ABC transporter ATP-binding protein [Paenibacillus sp. J5C2022]